MKLLLDTHTMVWYWSGEKPLPDRVVSHIRNPAHSIFISPASLWELAIKISLGKWILHVPYSELMYDLIVRYNFQILHITPLHTEQILTLPLPVEHRDPFDRLLAAQALAEDIPILSIDECVDVYHVVRLWK